MKNPSSFINICCFIDNTVEQWNLTQNKSMWFYLFIFCLPIWNLFWDITQTSRGTATFRVNCACGRQVYRRSQADSPKQKAYSSLSYSLLLQKIIQLVDIKWRLQRCCLAKILCQELILPTFDGWNNNNTRKSLKFLSCIFQWDCLRVSNGGISNLNIMFCMVTFHKGGWNCVPLSESITLGLTPSTK